MPRPSSRGERLLASLPRLVCRALQTAVGSQGLALHLADWVAGRFPFPLHHLARDPLLPARAGRPLPRPAHRILEGVGGTLPRVLPPAEGGACLRLGLADLVAGDHLPHLLRPGLFGHTPVLGRHERLPSMTRSAPT